MCSGTVNYTAGGTGKGQGFPRSLVAVVAGGGGGGSGVQRPNVSWTKHMKYGDNFSLFAASFFPIIKKRKGNYPQLGFQSPAERSRIRTRNLMYSNRASVINSDYMSEIYLIQSKCF